MRPTITPHPARFSHDSPAGRGHRSYGLEAGIVGDRAVPVTNLLRGFSFALDLSQGVRRGHAIRTAFSALKIAERAELGVIEQADVFFAA